MSHKTILIPGSCTSLLEIITVSMTICQKGNGKTEHDPEHRLRDLCQASSTVALSQPRLPNARGLFSDKVTRPYVSF